MMVSDLLRAALVTLAAVCLFLDLPPAQREARVAADGIVTRRLTV